MSKFIDLGGDSVVQQDQPGKKKNYYLLILDKSGSMGGVREVTVSGFNEQVQSMKKAAEDYEDQEFYVSLVVFSDARAIETVYWNRPVHQANELTLDGYMTDGMTALQDAVMGSVNRLRGEIADELDNEDVAVIVSIFTDGHENDSRDYPGAKGKAQVKSLVEELKGTGKWIVNYIGATADTMTIAADYGISANNTVKYAATKGGTSEAMAMMSRSIGSFSSMRSKGVIATDDYFGAAGPVDLTKHAIPDGSSAVIDEPMDSSAIQDELNKVFDDSSAIKEDEEDEKK